jgi:putative ABC transport system ATP-binding protein
MANAIYKLTNIVKSYQVGAVAVDALRGLSIVLDEGEFVALQGPSGSGKSTMLNVLGLLERPTSGAIEFSAII